jgi:uncharacterized protein YdeI (YjbR/CyaY-like superfamily)
MKPRFFKARAAFRAWLDRHHADTPELWGAFHKKDSGKGGITYKEGMDEALCFGWRIDGVKKRVDEHSYMHRFTPRRRGSCWTAVNTKRMQELIARKLVAPSGLAAFERRDREKTKKYSFEREAAAFDLAARAFQANAPVWTFFRAEPPGYRKLLTFYITSAKQPETRFRRLEVLMKESSEGTRLR